MEGYLGYNIVDIVLFLKKMLLQMFYVNNHVLERGSALFEIDVIFFWSPGSVISLFRRRFKLLSLCNQ